MISASFIATVVYCYLRKRLFPTMNGKGFHLLALEDSLFFPLEPFMPSAQK